MQTKCATTAVQGIVLPPDAPVLRIPTRPPEHRDGDFAAQFDHTTLFYDAFRDIGGRRLRLIGPPLFNLRPYLESGSFTAVPSGERCSFEIVAFDRLCEVLVELPPGCEQVALDCALGRFVIDVVDSSRMFAGHRVLITMSRNNHLTWICDWLRFNRDAHGATAVLFYDNNSTAYTLDELRDAIATVPGIEVAAVVKWPYKYGPSGRGMKQFWDSNFSQLGMFESARWRFLADARSVLNTDIDELVVSRHNRSIFEAVERSMFGVVAFYGDWIFGIENVTRAPDPTVPIRYLDFRHVLAPIRKRRYGVIATYPMRCKTKWAVVPRRCPAGAQWHTHAIKRWLASRLISRSFRFRHFRELNSNWKYDRLTREPMDEKRHLPDELMTRTFAQVSWNA